MESSSGVGAVHCCARVKVAERETRAEKRKRRKRQRPEMFMIWFDPLLLCQREAFSSGGYFKHFCFFFWISYCLLFLEDSAALFVGGDDAGELLDIGIFVRG